MAVEFITSEQAAEKERVAEAEACNARITTLQAKVLELQEEMRTTEDNHLERVEGLLDAGAEVERRNRDLHKAIAGDAARAFDSQAAWEALAEMERRLGEWEKRYPDHCYSCEKRCLYAGTDDVGALRCAECLLRTQLAARDAEVAG